jgi:hypothetical protein
VQLTNDQQNILHQEKSSITNKYQIQTTHLPLTINQGLAKTSLHWHTIANKVSSKHKTQETKSVYSKRGTLSFIEEHSL